MNTLLKELMFNEYSQYPRLYLEEDCWSCRNRLEGNLPLESEEVPQSDILEVSQVCANCYRDCGGLLVHSFSPEEAHRSNAKIMEIQSEKSSVDTADISGAGQISNNMAKDFQRSVQKQEAKQDAGKSKPLYQYTVNRSADNVIEEFKSQYDKGKAPKEVQKADFVTVTKDKTDSKVVEKADGTKEVVNTTTVKINAYNNYKPSVYVAPTVYPEVHRVDVVYTNRDILLGVNYDKNRDGNKFGVSVGYRIKSW